MTDETVTAAHSAPPHRLPAHPAVTGIAEPHTMTYRPVLRALTRLALAAPLLAGWAGPASAQPADAPLPSEVSATAPAPVIQDPARVLLLSFGNRDGLARLSERLVDQLRADPQHGPRFKELQPAQLKLGLADQFCRALQGACGSGAEARLTPPVAANLSQADLQAMLPLLRDSMDAQAVPPAAQAALLSRLAPAHSRLAAAR